MSYVVETGVTGTNIWYWKSPELDDIPERVNIDREESEDWARSLQSLKVKRTKKPQKRRLRRNGQRDGRETKVWCPKVKRKTMPGSVITFPLYFTRSRLEAGFRWRKPCDVSPESEPSWPCEDRGCSVMSSACMGWEEVRTDLSWGKQNQGTGEIVFGWWMFRESQGGKGKWLQL